MGYIKIKLADLIYEKGESKNQVCYHCQIQRTQLNNYCNNKVSRVDLALLARVCSYLKCDITNLLEYVNDDPPSEESTTKICIEDDKAKKD